jgi:hypothetical protein
MAAFVDKPKSDLITKLFDYLKIKVSTLENEDLTTLHQILILLPPAETRFTKSLESLTLRRSYGLSPIEASKIVKAYSMRDDRPQ